MAKISTQSLQCSVLFYARLPLHVFRTGTPAMSKILCSLWGSHLPGPPSFPGFLTHFTAALNILFAVDGSLYHPSCHHLKSVVTEKVTNFRSMFKTSFLPVPLLWVFLHAYKMLYILFVSISNFILCHRCALIIHNFGGNTYLTFIYKMWL